MRNTRRSRDEGNSFLSRAADDDRRVGKKHRCPRPPGGAKKKAADGRRWTDEKRARAPIAIASRVTRVRPPARVNVARGERRPLRSSLLSCVETRVELRVVGDAEIGVGEAVRERTTSEKRVKRREGRKERKGGGGISERGERKKSSVGRWHCSGGEREARCGAQLPSAVARAVLVDFLHSLLRQRFQPISERWRKRNRK